MPNHLKIIKYIDLYRSILARHGFSIDPIDASRLHELITLIFEIDTRYERAVLYPDRVEIANLKEITRSLFPEYPEIVEPAIDRFFTAMERENDPPSGNSLNQYLEISSDSIGSHLLASQIACFLGIPAAVWLSPPIAALNREINELIRLANDYLDITVDRFGDERELPQIKAGRFLPNPFLYKLYFFSRFILHRFRYRLTALRFRFRRDGREYLRALHCSRSILEWAYRVYVIDKNSCRDPIDERDDPDRSGLFSRFQALALIPVGNR
jgi:hypothetical protein